MTVPPTEVVATIAEAGSPVLRVTTVSERRPWLRRVTTPGDARLGPWRFQANHDVVDWTAYNRLAACLYLVLGNDGRVRYVGKTTARLRTRWPIAPAVDAETGQQLSNQLFHTCWEAMEAECAQSPALGFEVRAITEPELAQVILALGGEVGHLASAAKLAEDVESWILLRAPPPWNKVRRRRAARSTPRPA